MLRELVEQSRARSAVFDVITNRVPVTIDVRSWLTTRALRRHAGGEEIRDAGNFVNRRGGSATRPTI